MSQAAPHRIDQFFNGPGGRADNWRDLVEAAKAWAAGKGDRGKYEALLNDLSVTEEFHGYPGLQLMATLREASGDAAASLCNSPSGGASSASRSQARCARGRSVLETLPGSNPALTSCSSASRSSAERLAA